MAVFRYAMKVKNSEFESRYKVLQRKGKLSPNAIERVMGIILLLCLFHFIMSKYEDETMIFMLNPCHFTALLQVICCFCSFNKWTELVAMTSFAFSFGGWIGNIFPELEGYS